MILKTIKENNKMNIEQVKALRKEKRQIIEWLIEHFPEAFSKSPTQIKPLKIGIYDDIADYYDRLDTPSFSKKMLKEALSYYSGSPSYLLNQKVNTPRVDLFGNEVDVVTEAQSRYANERYERKFTKKSTPSMDKSKVNA